MQVLQMLHNEVKRKQRNKWQGQWFLHNDNTNTH
jgi:hypothetical protein